MNKKTRWIAVILAGICTLTAVLAYSYVQRTRINSLEVGQNTIRILEDFEPPAQLTAGENDYRKEITVENTGSADCYVRRYFSFSDSELENCSYLKSGDGEYVPAAQYAEHLPQGWVYDSSADITSGWYYFTEPLKPGDRTEIFLSSVRTVFENAEAVQPYEIIVYAESVQTLDHNGEWKDWQSCWQSFLARR